MRIMRRVDQIIKQYKRDAKAMLLLRSKPLTESELDDILKDPAVIAKTADNILVKEFKL